MFSGTQGSWLGTLGAFDIACEHDEEPEMAIYYEEDNSRTISEEIRLKYLASCVREVEPPRLIQKLH